MDHDGADFAGAGDVGAAAGLQVDGGVAGADSDQAQAAGAAGGLDGEGADQGGVGVEDGFVDPFVADGVVLFDQGVEGGFDGGFVRGFREVEVQAGAVGADGAAGDGDAGEDGAHEVHRGVHFHEGVARGPVDLGGDFSVDGGEVGGFGGEVEDGLAVALDGVGDAGFSAVVAQDAGVAGLAAGAGVEDGAVEDDAGGC